MLIEPTLLLPRQFCGSRVVELNVSSETDEGYVKLGERTDRRALQPASTLSYIRSSIIFELRFMCVNKNQFQISKALYQDASSCNIFQEQKRSEKFFGNVNSLFKKVNGLFGILFRFFDFGLFSFVLVLKKAV